MTRLIAPLTRSSVIVLTFLAALTLDCSGGGDDGGNAGGQAGDAAGGSGGGSAGSAAGRGGGSGGGAGSSSDAGSGGSMTAGSGGGGTAGGGSGGGGSAGSTAGAGGTPVAGSGGTPAGGMAGTPMAGMGGAAGAAGSAGVVDKSKEKVWFDAVVTLGGSKDAAVSSPMNWMAPVNYWGGSMHSRFVVTANVPQKSSVEICMWKSSPSDPKHTCALVMNAVDGLGEQIRNYPKTEAVLLNANARTTMVAADFEGPFVLSKFRLTPNGDHGSDLAGPVTGRLTIVLVPAGQTFSGFAGYPK